MSVQSTEPQNTEQPKKNGSNLSKKIKKPNPVPNSEATQFKEGNTAAEVWTEEVVLEKLEKAYLILSNDEATMEEAENPIRANSIKLQKEVMLMCGIRRRVFSEWKEKFTYPRRRDYTTNEMIDNPTYSVAVSDAIAEIEDICECRLQYSGSSMDVFILKNNYGFKDQIDHDVTTGGKELPATTVAPIVNIIEQH